MDANVEPFKMADGKLTAVKVEHHGMIEVIEIDPTPFTEYHVVVSLVREYLKARLEHALAQSKYEDARDVLAATTDNFENAQRKMKFLQLSVVQAVRTPATEPKLIIREQQIMQEAPTKSMDKKLADIAEMEKKVESLGDIAERHRMEMEVSLKSQEQPAPKLAPTEPRRIIIGADTTGLIRKEETVTIPVRAEPQSQPEPKHEAAPVEQPAPIEFPKPLLSIPTSAKGWAAHIYSDVLQEIKHRTKGNFTDNDLIIEVTLKGVPPELIMDTVEEIINLMKEKKLFEGAKPFWKKILGK